MADRGVRKCQECGEFFPGGSFHDCPALSGFSVGDDYTTTLDRMTPKPLTEEEARRRTMDRLKWLRAYADGGVIAYRDIDLMMAALPPITATVWPEEGEE